MKKLFRSLLAKYMLIILIALVLVQSIYLIVATFALMGKDMTEETTAEGMTPKEVEEQWHEEASHLERATEKIVGDHFAKWNKQYPESSMFWVDADGELRQQLNVKDDHPSQWTPSYTTKFIKERYDEDPFTVIAFIGETEDEGFIVLEIPRTIFHPPLIQLNEKFGTFLVIGVLFIIALFITISFLFFRGIRKRLLHLQEAMELRDENNLPVQVDVKKADEIGQLEESFNQMVVELKESKEREQEEEQLRRELIANLSHDLRTPLTKIRAQAYSITKENLSQEGKESIAAMETSIDAMDQLIENLMSYTLLMADKYQFEPREVDVIRFVRESLASWYPVFEKEGFEIVVDLPSLKQNKWKVDPIWFGRILDNLLQNVLRHAKGGRYVEVKTASTNAYDAIILSDRGRGFHNQSNEKGAGIGLSIVDLMVKGMDLDWDVESSEKGTTIKVKRYK